MPKKLKWLTQSEYAKIKGIKPASVHDAIKAGRIEWNGKTGKDCRVRGPMVDRRGNARKQKVLQAQEKGELDIEKARVDVELKLQKLASIRREQRRSYMQTVCEVFVQTFAPFKAHLIELRLDQTALTALSELWGKCITDFNSVMAERIAEEESEAEDAD